jgi:hypothetical protein
MSALLEYAGKKPVYMNCAYNFYKIKRIVDVGDYVIIESYEEDGCWTSL